MNIETEFEWNQLLEVSSSAEETIEIISAANKFDYWLASNDALKKSIKYLSFAKNSDDFIFIYKFIDKHIDETNVDHSHLLDALFSRTDLRDEIIGKIPSYFSTLNLGKKRNLHQFIDSVSKNNSYETESSVSRTLDNLIKAGASIKSISSGKDPITYAFSKGSVPVIRSFFMKFGGSLIGGPKNCDYTPLILQIRNGSSSSIKELIELGADLRKMGRGCSFTNALDACVNYEAADKFLVFLESEFFTEEEIKSSVRSKEGGGCRSIAASWLFRKNIEKIIADESKNNINHLSLK